MGELERVLNNRQRSWLIDWSEMHNHWRVGARRMRVLGEIL